MNKQALLKYAELKIQASKIEAELEFLKPEVLKSVAEIRGDSEDPVALQEFPGYSFTLQNRKTWKYSGIVADLDKRLKERKKTEEANGDATFEEKPQLMFLSPKE